MKNVIERFYDSLGKLDAEAMIDCYHEDVNFHDPAFGTLHGEKAGNMWRMLCGSQNGQDFKIKLTDVEIDGSMGKSHLEAWYTFTRTGRRVHNIIDSEFEFSNGRIIKHNDRFDLYRWSRQALGLTGLLIGWTPYFRKKLNAQTNRMLTKFERRMS